MDVPTPKKTKHLRSKQIFFPNSTSKKNPLQQKLLPTRGQLGPLKQLRVYSWGYGFRGGGSFQTGMTVVERLGGDLDLHFFWKLP